MWSLPDISKLNESAVKEYEARKDKPVNELLKGKECQICGTEKATTATDYYDIFSDTPKGQIFTCDDCYPEQEGDLFYCQSCKRYHVSNYTRELYHTTNEFGEDICLNCALDAALEDADNFIYQKGVGKIDFEKVKQAKHLIPVEGKYWKEKLEFEGNVEFDSSSGQCISGGGIDELKSLCRDAVKKSKSKRCILILDAAYQFAISIGVYYEKN